MRWRDRITLARKVLTTRFDASSQQLVSKILSGNGSIVGMRHPPPRDGEALQRAYAETSPWLRAGVGRLAMSVGSVQWRVYAGVGSTRDIIPDRQMATLPFAHRMAYRANAVQKGTLTEFPNHPLATLLNGSSGIIVGFALRELTQVWIDLVGEAFWALERNEFGVPTGAWPVPPHWVAEFPTEQAPVYRVTYGTLNVQIPVRDMVRFHRPHPINPYARGNGVGYVLRNEVDVDEYASLTARSRFANHAVPPAIISAPEIPTEEQAQEFKQKWMSDLQGFFKFGIPKITSYDLKVHELSQSFESLQFSQLRVQERDIVMQVLGIPPEIIGNVENANRSTISAAEYLYNKLDVAQRLEFQRQVYQAQLVPQYKDDRIIVDFDNPVEEDSEFALRAAQIMPYTITVDEWRTKFQGLPALGGEIGGRFIVSNRVTIYDEPGGQPSTEVPESTPKVPAKANGHAQPNGQTTGFPSWEDDADEDLSGYDA